MKLLCNYIIIEPTKINTNQDITILCLCLNNLRLENHLV